ncbi:MAG: DUF2199 domain-containing protein [Myxococcales bacterium]|nr:DUF2199 domain-containing protein [Myxococcales bacterium]
MSVTETSRDELLCDCGCGHRWLVTRGSVRTSEGERRFIAIPTAHKDTRFWWMALEVEAGRWALTRTWIQEKNVNSQTVDLAISPLRGVVPFASDASAAMLRADVLAKPALKEALFAAHDLVIRHHPSIGAHLDPEMGRDFSFKAPDCVWSQPPKERSPRNQLNFAECGHRLFVRALFAIPVSDGAELRVGLWVEVSTEDFFELLKVWDDPAKYVAFRANGVVENSLALRGRDVRGSRATLAPRNADECLFFAAVDEPALDELLKTGVSVRDLDALVTEVRSVMTRQATPPSTAGAS